MIPLAATLMSGALGMIVTGVLSIDEAYNSVDWMTVFLFAGLIPLGIAFESTFLLSTHQVNAPIMTPGRLCRTRI